MECTEAPICHPDPISRQVCCVPGALIRDAAERLPDCCYALLVVHMAVSDIESSSLKSIKKDYRALGKVVRGPRAQIVFSLVIQVKGE